MYTLINSEGIRSTVLAREGASLAAALVVAELFYKFGSFTLEAVAFVATWYVFGLSLSWITSLTGRN